MISPLPTPNSEEATYVHLQKKIAELELALAQRDQELARVRKHEKGPVAEKVPIHFRGYCPRSIRLGEWKTLLTYAHVPEALAVIQADSQKQLGAAVTNYALTSTQSALTVERGTDIVVVPELPGVRFNPTRASVTWLEDWHRVEFRMQALDEASIADHEDPVRGRVSFFVGPILIAELPMETRLRPAGEPADDGPLATFSAEPYQAVFVSYSHKDKVIVDRLQQAYRALGMTYLRDVNILRSGEDWNVALLGKIDEADIFQLCWSSNARQSDAVEREWRHAMNRSQDHFIRPVYWEVPMPKVPNELQHIHFSLLDW